MDDVRARLEQCFLAVFPDLTPAEIPDASPATVEAWDSLANATLVSVIEEEFGVELPMEELAELASFSLLLDHLQSEPNVR
ncbi:acyl carrier protein familyprotein [Gemmatirosa kalamazoonensis]|uniref:Acyl carrier protein familyprotein n=1 Tax=Gemmatirosa kalamazoonensis TaxID=861299 RepID=W0RHZ0_9BACT|nr:acyl carrier protein [Gemmatirosa kalamazoonensis]AHG90047.1 acyl carrier protein familyprotein [Gemmatirosa kalamazoonensis]